MEVNTSTPREASSSTLTARTLTEKFPDVHAKRRLTRLPVSEGVLDQAVDMDLAVMPPAG